MVEVALAYNHAQGTAVAEFQVAYEILSAMTPCAAQASAGQDERLARRTFLHLGRASVPDTETIGNR